MANRLANPARVVDSAVGCPEIPIIVGPGNARVVMWPGNNAQFRTFQIITLERGARTIRLHHGSDAVYYVMGGAGSSFTFTGSNLPAWLTLSSAGLLMRSFYHLRSIDPGFDPHGVLTFSTDLPDAQYKDKQQIEFYDRAL